MPRERKIFLIALALWLLFNFGYLHLNCFDLSGDEAYYWDWSRRPALGYYSKPPLTAYIIRALTWAGGDTEWAIRSGALLFSAGSVAALYALTLRITRNERAALLAALSTLATPLAWAGAMIMTIDAPLMFFWVLAMYCFHRALRGERAMWAAAGLALGLGMLSKYTMAALYVSFALYLALADRKWLKTPWPWLALGISLACMSGALYWNWLHGWVSIRHTAGIGAPDRHGPLEALGNLLNYFAGQLGVVSPILFGFYGWALWQCARRMRENRDALFLCLCFGVLFGFYALVSLLRAPNANWPVCAYPTAAIAFGWMWTERPQSQSARRWLAVALLLGCAIGIFARFTDVVYWAGAPVPQRLDPTNKLRGGRELGAALSKYAADPLTGPFVFSDRYQMTAYAAFYTKGRPRAYCVNAGHRNYNQYDLWGGWEDLAGRDGIFVTGGDAARAALWIDGLVGAGAFESGELLETVDVRRGKILIRTYVVCRMRRYSGIPMNAGSGRY